MRHEEVDGYREGVLSPAALGDCYSPEFNGIMLHHGVKREIQSWLMLANIKRVIPNPVTMKWIIMMSYVGCWICYQDKQEGSSIWLCIPVTCLGLPCRAASSNRGFYGRASLWKPCIVIVRVCHVGRENKATAGGRTAGGETAERCVSVRGPRR